MGYDIYIGNAEMEGGWGDAPRAEWVVLHHEEEDAPVFPFDEMTHNSNTRSPSYSGWANFTNETGLSMLFYGVEDANQAKWYDGGILNRHPGIVQLTYDMFSTIRWSRVRWQERHHNAVPGWDFDPLCYREGKNDGVRGRDGNLATLLWLEWWTSWAVSNCERPAIYNT